jgi:MYXO-CTERM domain-containing protein
VIGIAAQLSFTGAALAQWTPSTAKVLAADPNDTARTQNGRLRKTRYAETNEQATVRLFGDGKTGLYVDMHSGAINGTQPVHRQQASCTPVQLTQAADGSVGATADNTKSKFVTDNVGQDYRNANKPEIVPINGGKNMLLMFNYRPQGTNDTNRYVKVLDAACNAVPITDANGATKKQVLVMHKDNDNCDMHQSGEGPCDIATDANGQTHLTCWAGCNGNGQDDGWLNDITVKCTNDAAGNATGCQVTKNFDVSLCKREERSRGRCSIADADPNTAICTWTEGNDQPQTDGTWIAAVDINPAGQAGESAQTRVLWKKQIEAEKRIEGVRTYSVRANSSRIMTENADGTITRSNQLFIATDDLRGNNTNNRKGGRYLGQNLGVAEATKDGLKWVINMTPSMDMMLGVDATHLTMAHALIQDQGKTIPAMTFLQGSQNGAGGTPPDLKVIAADFASGKFVDYGTHPAGGMYDRHLYSNYLGGNPGNQGRNFAGAQMIRNPFVGVNGNDTKYLMLHALTGKDPADVAKPEIKPTTFISIVALKNPTITPPPPPGMPAMTQTGQNGSGGGQNSQPQAGDPPMPPSPQQPPPSDPPASDNPPPAQDPAPMASDPQTGGFTGGCSMASAGSKSTGFGLMLLGLCLFVVVRRKRA